MTPSEKEKIIKEGFDTIRRVYNLRDDLLTDAGKLEAAKESNRKLSDRVANLEVTIKTLNAAIDKKDAEIHRLNNRLKSRDDAMLATIDALEENRDNIYDKYLELCHIHDADVCIKKQMIADNRKKKEEIKRLKDKYNALHNVHVKLCRDYDVLHKAMITEVMGYAAHDIKDEELEAEKESYACDKRKSSKLESDFHELRRRFNDLYFYYIHGTIALKDITSFTDWFKDTFGDFGVYDEEE